MINKYYENESGILYYGECLEVMDELIEAGIKVDAIITDPPYGIFGNGENKYGVDKGKNWNTSSEEELAWDNAIDFDPMWEKIKELRKKLNSNIILFGNDSFSYKLKNSNEQEYKYSTIWNKQSAGIGIFAKHQPLKQYEDIMHFYNDRNNSDKMKKYHWDILQASGKTKNEIAKLFKKVQVGNIFLDIDNADSSSLAKISDKSRKGINEYQVLKDLVDNKLDMMSYSKYCKQWESRTYNPIMEKTERPIKTSNVGGKYNITKKNQKNGFKNNKVRYEKYPINIIDFKKVTHEAQHPTQKPLPLMMYLIKTYTNEGDKVLDFTAGSGVTLLACQLLGREFIGIEIQDKYCKIIKDNLELKTQVKFNQEDMDKVMGVGYNPYKNKGVMLEEDELEKLVKKNNVEQMTLDI